MGDRENKASVEAGSGPLAKAKDTIDGTPADSGPLQWEDGSVNQVLEVVRRE